MEIDLKKVVFTSVHVIAHSMPILYVVHDEDDDWQFLSGEETGSDEDGRIISMGTALQLDGTLNKITWLPIGASARRSSIDSEWETDTYQIHEK